MNNDIKEKLLQIGNYKVKEIRKRDKNRDNFKPWRLLNVFTKTLLEKIISLLEVE